MFLTKTNHIRWKHVAFATGLVAALCAVGIIGADMPVYQFLRRLDWSGWKILETISSFKFWLILSLVSSCLFWAMFIVKSKRYQEKVADQLSLWKKLKAFVEETIEYFAYLLKQTKTPASQQVPAFTGMTNIWSLMFGAVFLSGFIGWILKFCLGRMRPVFFDALGLTGFLPFTNEWAFNSMPSGHTIASFAALVFIGLCRPKWKWLTWSIAIIIGLSRVAIGAHWASDVLLGAFIGMLAADLVISIAPPKNR